MWALVGCLLFAPAVISNKLQTVQDERNYLLKKELNMMVGSDIVLSDSELVANETIMALKLHELDSGFKNPQLFHCSKHFFEYKDSVKETPLYKIIQKMPKGAVLHAHDTGLLGPDHVLNYTYWDNLHICYEDDTVKFLFSRDTPTSPCGNQWQLLKNVRYSSGNVEKFDDELRKHFTIVIDKPLDVYTDINKVWSKFQNYFISTSGLLYYKPLWEQYFYDTLKAFREDNVMYIEMRSVLPELYDLDGNTYDAVTTAETYKKVLDVFVRDYPDFFGVRLIYAPLKMGNSDTVKEYIRTAKVIKKKLPRFFAGFDLVGQEDIAPALINYLPELVDAADELDYFLHAGETNWQGLSDENIFDAVALKTKRIGHGYAIAKHPILKEEVKKRGIALEVNVVSNHVLKLVEDVRNHPLATFLAEGMPVVLSSDDPGVWEADPMSHDFYLTFLGVASRRADLRLLKKLALNSLYYSTYPDKEKIVFEFEKRWTKFIGNGEFLQAIGS
ncbi:adenosine deaminase 2-like [Cydia splendana]|uniref:adenosine deaminase 2-like n=1 Tax=Cydia splendana TaxID=1100963 RepID=UPI0021415344